jgi:hypothetical protein
MTMSIAFFNCPHCIDSFGFDWQKVKSLTLHSRVMPVSGLRECSRGCHERIFGDSQRRAGELSMGRSSGNFAA